MTSQNNPLLNTLKFERVDSIPVVLTILIQMGIPAIIDTLYIPHGNHQGLSVGWLAVVFLTYMLTESNHKMCPVRAWVEQHRWSLERLSGQPIRPTDCTDDRLGDVLGYLSDERLWQALEQAVGQRILRVYHLERTGPVRLDATTGEVNHDARQHELFQVGRSKEGGFAVQFKVMLGVLDPLGLPLAADVVAGHAADDPLYVPIYRRIRQTLKRTGLLYIGDCKMGALETRATIVAGGDFYLMPLAMTGDIPALLAAQVDKVVAEEVALTPIYLPEELPTAPAPELALAEGFESVRPQTATLADGRVVTWDERLLTVRSQALAETQQQALDARVERAEAELLALTPAPGRGKRRYDDAEALQQAIDAILTRYAAAPFLTVTWERQLTSRHLRAYRGRPARTEERVRYQVHVTRRAEAIASAKARLGWRIYVTQAPLEQLSLATAVLAYRDQYLAEQSFARLKGSLLALLPLYVQRDDHAQGLLHLLTLALRALVLIEFVVRRTLAEEQTTLQGVYAGNPQRRTARPTARLLLEAFDDITLAIRCHPAGEVVDTYLTPLNSVQVRILALLGLSPGIYDCLTGIPVAWPLCQEAGHPVNILAG